MFIKNQVSTYIMQGKIELREDIEYAVHCEKDGKVIGPISKIHAHLPEVRTNLTHYSTWSMIFNQKLQKYGIQKKNPKKHDKFGAGKWDMGVAGHNCYVSDKSKIRFLDFEENLIKEAKEEIGIDLEMCDSTDKLISKSKNLKNNAIGIIIENFLYQTKENSEWIGLGFIITNSEKVTFTDDEVVDFMWLTSDELRKFLKEDNNYCSPLPLVFDKAEKFRLTFLKK